MRCGYFFVSSPRRSTPLENWKCKFRYIYNNMVKTGITRALLHETTTGAPALLLWHLTFIVQKHFNATKRQATKFSYYIVDSLIVSVCRSWSHQPLLHGFCFRFLSFRYFVAYSLRGWSIGLCIGCHITIFFNFYWGYFYIKFQNRTAFCFPSVSDR